MTVPIRPLPDTLINQIAAGEVVERPASVVKELVENALDAGARRVDVELEEGGIRLIRIRDDGGGIAAAELPLAVSRHATSKIATLDDLETVATLGFRGEALPSIASVSRFALTSRRDGDEHGAGLVIDGGKPGPVTPKSHPIGTTVEVRDLFYNVPARRKFLRAERTELGHVEEWLRSLALARPDIELRISHNGKPARRYKADAAQPQSRLLEALGEAFASQALRLDHAGAGLRLHGWIAHPDYSRGSADQQYLYVNGRAVRDRNIAHAVRAAYQELLAHGRQPAHVLFLELEPARVDVNVHPAKHEVRFRDARLIHDFVQRTLHEALADVRASYVPAPALAPSAPGMPQAPYLPGQPWNPQQRYAHGLQVADGVAAYTALYSPSNGAEQAATPASTVPPPFGHALAQLHGRYVLTQTQDGIGLLDLRAANEHLAWTRLHAAHSATGLQSQPLLVPLAVVLTTRQAEIATGCQAVLESLGFDLQIDGAAAELRSAPALLSGIDHAGLLPELLDALAETNAGDPQSALQLMARHLSHRLPRLLTLPEMDALLRQLEAKHSGADPHGTRRLWRQISLEELQREFEQGA